MINSFLVTLYNSGTQPTNPDSTDGDVLWPNPYTPKTYTAPEQTAALVLFNGLAGLDKFLICIDLLWLVESSVCSDYIFRDDPRTTYTETQLLAQFTNIDPDDFDYYQINRILAQFDSIPALQFLTGDLLQIYRTALSPLDRLAAVIAHFGMRPDLA